MEVEQHATPVVERGGRRGQKRKRRRSNEVNALKAPRGAAKGGAGTAEDDRESRPRHRQMSVSSKTVANHVMTTRLLGSESDPLNLEGLVGGATKEEREGEGECSTCAPSPVFAQTTLLAPPLSGNPRDPLNLEGQIPEHSTAGFNRPGGRRRRRGGRRRTVSCSEEGQHEDVGKGGRGGARGGRGGGGRGRGRRRKRSQSKKMDTSDSAASTGPSYHPPVFKPQDQRYCYGNYDMYYGYRCSSRGAMEVNDPRIGLMRREWFQGKNCLDIGCNTGQITLVVAQQLSPRRIVGIDIDPKLVRIANKNLFRQQVPTVAPDGRAFPSSFTSRASFSLLSKPRGRTPRLSTPQPFPNNVEFTQENYVPESEEGVTSTHPEYDVILALSLTKWVHLNWGDAGLRRMFRKMFRHLRPGGRLILEPQPFSSYARKKKLTPAIYKNYYAIEFRPDQFHAFLMSQEVGFSEHKFLGIPRHKSEGFRRPLHVYIKSKSETKDSTGGGEEGRGEGERGSEDMVAAVVMGGEGEKTGVEGGEGEGVVTEGVVVTGGEEKMMVECGRGGGGGGGGGGGAGGGGEDMETEASVVMGEEVGRRVGEGEGHVKTAEDTVGEGKLETKDNSATSTCDPHTDRTSSE